MKTPTPIHDALIWASTLAMIALVLLGVVSCQTWRYGECKRVGHGTAYCVVQLAR